MDQEGTGEMQSVRCGITTAASRTRSGEGHRHRDGGRMTSLSLAREEQRREARKPLDSVFADYDERGEEEISAASRA